MCGGGSRYWFYPYLLSVCLLIACWHITIYIQYIIYITSYVRTLYPIMQNSIFASQELRSALLIFTLGIVRRIFVIPAHCHLLDFDSYAPCNDSLRNGLYQDIQDADMLVQLLMDCASQEINYGIRIKQKQYMEMEMESLSRIFCYDMHVSRLRQMAGKE